MRYNKHELFALASQTSHNFDKEGILAMRERQEGFFRRSEGTVVRWFRLRGNLLFYLKGPEPWHEPLGLVVLGNHIVNLLEQDENGVWPFHIVWSNGVCYRLATFSESDRSLWLSAIQTASHEAVSARFRELKSRLETTRPAIDLTTYRQHKGIGNDMTEIPLCELALSCDNLVCDALGRPPSPRVVVYVRLSKTLCVKYGATEVVEKSSNPSFSRTIAFLASDGLTGDAVVRLVVYDVRERLSGTAVPLGFTSMQLATIQEAHRLRVALQSLDNKTVGFVTASAWSVEPAGPSPTRGPPFHDTPSDAPKIFCHRRSQSLPPRLGLKHILPSYTAIFRQNFVNGTTATFRFNSGLGGEIAVHELMAESAICYQMPIQLLEIYIEHEKDLLEGLLSVSVAGSTWRARQVELAGSHVALMKRYCHARSSMMHVDTGYFKPSARKDDASLEFAPVNLHLQRMWVCNDTLNRAAFHDIVTVGAFAAHAHSAERTGGLIRLVQQAKGITDCNAAQYSATASKIDAAHECVYATRRLRDGIVAAAKEAVAKLEAGETECLAGILEDIKSKAKSIVALWDPVAVEETLASIGWPNDAAESDVNDHQALAAILRFTEALNVNTFETLEWEAIPSSSSSSKDASPLVEFPPLSSSVPNVCVDKASELKFELDHFGRERGNRLNNSLRSVKGARVHCEPSRTFDNEKMRPGSFRHEFKSSASLEQVSYKDLMESASPSAPPAPLVRRMSRQGSSSAQGLVDEETRRQNLAALRQIGFDLQDALRRLITDLETASVSQGDDLQRAVEEVKTSIERVRDAGDVAAVWQRRAAAAMRARSEPPRLTKERAALQSRRDACFSQALTTVSTALTSWLNTAPHPVIVKLLTSGLGPLCGFEGLLSLYSTEKAMWGDMVVAVEDLHTVVFTLYKAGVIATPYIQGTRENVTVYLPVTEVLYNQFTAKKHRSFNITAVFFNMGINEKATLAEALGETAPQHQSNTDNLERLTNYYHKYIKLFSDVKLQQPVAAPAASRSRPLEEVMALLRASVHRNQPKNTELLQLASLATRLMFGVRITSCKSAKDRTGMSATLEQCAVLTSEYRLAPTDMQCAIDAMRSEGCRRENTEKNIGVRKYAFTKKQVMDLPPEYRPPAGTYGSSQT